MMQGLRCVDLDAAAKINAFAFQHGLIIEQSGAFDEVIKCLMPLTTTDDELDEGLDSLQHAMNTVFDSSYAGNCETMMLASA